jgi:hypothetical protein
MTLRRASGVFVALLATMSLAACGESDKAPSRVPGDAAAPSVFPAPSSTVAAPRKAVVRRATAACRGRGIEQVRATYLKRARQSATQPDRRFLKLVAEQDAPTTVPLAARIYSMTVSKSSRADAYTACAHVLSLKESPQ